MKKPLTFAMFGLLASATALAGQYEWTAGWGMGVNEYAVSDGNANELVIACPDSSSEGLVSATAIINGQMYSSTENGGFGVMVDGELFDNPFDAECRVCAANFEDFWPRLRAANRLQLVADGVQVNLPLSNIQQVLPALGSAENTCRTGW